MSTIKKSAAERVASLQNKTEEELQKDCELLLEEIKNGNITEDDWNFIRILCAVISNPVMKECCPDHDARPELDAALQEHFGISKPRMEMLRPYVDLVLFGMSQSLGRILDDPRAYYARLRSR